MNWYPDWEAAAAASKQRMAISEVMRIRIPGTGESLPIQIKKPLHGDPEYIYQTAPGLRVHRLDKPTARDCDKVRRWKPW